MRANRAMSPTEQSLRAALHDRPAGITNELVERLEGAVNESGVELECDVNGAQFAVYDRAGCPPDSTRYRSKKTTPLSWLTVEMFQGAYPDQAFSEADAERVQAITEAAVWFVTRYMSGESEQ